MNIIEHTIAWAIEKWEIYKERTATHKARRKRNQYIAKKRKEEEMAMWRKKEERLAKYNGRMVVSERGALRHEFATKADENAYWRSIVNDFYDKHGDLDDLLHPDYRKKK